MWALTWVIIYIYIYIYKTLLCTFQGLQPHQVSTPLPPHLAGPRHLDAPGLLSHRAAGEAQAALGRLRPWSKSGGLTMEKNGKISEIHGKNCEITENHGQNGGWTTEKWINMVKFVKIMGKMVVELWKMMTFWYVELIFMNWECENGENGGIMWYIYIYMSVYSVVYNSGTQSSQIDSERIQYGFVWPHRVYKMNFNKEKWWSTMINH